MTPAKALSNSDPYLIDAAVAAPIATVATPAAVATTLKHFFPTPTILLNPLSSFVKSRSMVFIVALNAARLPFVDARAILNDLSIIPAILIASLYSFPFVDNLRHLLYQIQ